MKYMQSSICNIFFDYVKVFFVLSIASTVDSNSILEDNRRKKVKTSPYMHKKPRTLPALSFVVRIQYKRDDREGKRTTIEQRREIN